MKLELKGGARVGDLELAVDLTFADREVVVVLGPNGAGKSTLLRVIAGLQPLDYGYLALDGVLLDSPAGGVLVSPEKRSVGLMFQDYRLFPHMSVVDNVAFGVAARNLPADRAVAESWVARVGLARMGDARADQLSGGQAQRAALARALAYDPDIVLLDEPLAALDTTARSDVRYELVDHMGRHRGIKVLVTHDPIEAATFADRIVVLERGRVVQSGTLEEVAQRPGTRYAAEFAGINVWRGIASEGTVDLGAVRLVSAAEASGDVVATVRPTAISIYRRPPSGSPRNVWLGAISGMDLDSSRARVRLEAGVPVVAEITTAAASQLELAVGQRVWLAIKATEVDIHPA